MKFSKSDKPLAVTLLGSNSGRNAGDAAILAAIMGSLTKVYGENVRFEVPTTNPRFVIDNYGHLFNVQPVSMMPWTGSVRLFGIPTFASIRRTDMTFITDGIIFDINLFNPFFNFLILLVGLVPWIKFCGKKLVCYNVGIGPLNSYFGRKFAKYVGQNCDLIMVREEDSIALFKAVGVTKKIHLTADAVFANWPAEESVIRERLQELGLVKLAAENSLLGVNVTRYIDRWLQHSEKVSQKESFLPRFANVLAKLRLDHGITPVLFSTQIMDADFCRELGTLTATEYQSLGGKDSWRPALISNEMLSNHEILGLASCCRLFVGMRLHSLIIAAQAETPIVGLIYAPKVRSFLKQLNTPECALELAELTIESLYDALVQNWNNVDAVSHTQQQVVARLRKQTDVAAELVQELWNGSHEDSLESTKLAANQ